MYSNNILNESFNFYYEYLDDFNVCAWTLENFEDDGKTFVEVDIEDLLDN